MHTEFHSGYWKTVICLKLFVPWLYNFTFPHWIPQLTPIVCTLSKVKITRRAVSTLTAKLNWLSDNSLKIHLSFSALTAILFDMFCFFPGLHEGSHCNLIRYKFQILQLCACQRVLDKVIEITTAWIFTFMSNLDCLSLSPKIHIFQLSSFHKNCGKYELI